MHTLPPSKVLAVRTLGWCESPVGPLLAAATDDALCLLEFSDAVRVGERVDELGRHYADSLRDGANAILDELWRQLEQYFDRERCEFTLPLAYPGTAFQQQV